MSSDPPNVLFLMDDEHRPDVLGYAGDDVVRTPTLDRLAEDAVVFENAYTPSPACVPARQCLMIGELPRTCGCETYGVSPEHDLSPGSRTFARQFTEAGYDTAACGKLHHGGRDQMQGWTKRYGEHGPGDVYDVEAPEVRESDVSEGKWRSVKEVKRAGPGRATNRLKDDHAVDGAELFVESKFLDPFYDRATPDVPAMLKVSLNQPHYPFVVDEELFEYYLNRVEPYVEKPPDHRMLKGHWAEGYTVRPGEDATVREITRATAAYYGMVETVDRSYGRVLDRLEAAGENLDEWIIVFCSDHGELLGQHGSWQKSRFYEGSARVPLFVRWPEQFDGKRIEENVNLADLYATLCDLAGVPVPEDGAARDSRSLRPLLEGDTETWHRRYPGDETVSAYGDSVMIKRGDLKYMWFGDGERSVASPEVLFDLSTEEGEYCNRATEAAYEDDMAAFRERRQELGYGDESVRSAYESAGYS
jgi:choline-sulfatase